MVNTTAQTVASRLTDAGIGPDRVLLSGPQFEQAIALWNMEVERRPAVVVRCASPGEVREAVRVATASGLPLSVRGGGHDWAGRAIRDGGGVIDLTLMRSVEVVGDVAEIQGGATSLDLMTAAEREGLTTAAGTVGAVGYAGLATGGGYGPLTGRFGLAADNLGAEVVLADGRLVVADATHEPELFWALRGGGGNFGVFTSLRVRLHPRTTAFRSGFVVFPFEQARDVLRGYAELLADSPDELTARAGVIPAPDGSPVVFVAPAWSGGRAAGDAILDRIARLGSPIMNTVADTSYSVAMRAGDERVSVRGRYAQGTRTVAELTPALIDTLVELGRARTSAQRIINMHHVHGAATRVPLDTAFGLRRDHLVIELVASRPDGEEASPHQEWVRDATEALAPHSLPGGYPNLLGPDSHDQIAHAYGENAPRLLAAKARYDPDRAFEAIPLPLDGSRRTVDHSRKDASL